MPSDPFRYCVQTGWIVLDIHGGRSASYRRVNHTPTANYGCEDIREANSMNGVGRPPRVKRKLTKEELR